MPNFELTHFVICLQKRRVQVEAPDAATAKRRVLNGDSHGVVSRETVIFKSRLGCQEAAATASPANFKAVTDGDGCPIWVPE